MVFLPTLETQLYRPSLGVWGLIGTGMEETVVRPSVFVVDGQTDIPFTRLGPSRRRKTCSAARLGLALLLLLLVAGMAVQGWFLLQLHQRLGQMVTPLPVSGAGGLMAGWSPVSLRVSLGMGVLGWGGQTQSSEG